MNKISINNQIYSKFIKPDNTNETGLSVTANENKNITTNEQKPIASVSLKSEAEDSSKTFSKAVASIAIAGSVIGLLLFKSNSSSFYRKLNAYRQKLDDKIYDFMQKHNSAPLTFMQKAYINSTKAVRDLIEGTKILNNFTAIKDTAFMWMGEKLKLRKIFDGITNLFKKVSIYSSRKSHEKARCIADEGIQQLRTYTDKIRKSAGDEAATKFLDYLEKMEKSIMNATSAKTRAGRLRKTEEFTAGIGQKVRNEFWVILKKRTKNAMKKLRLYRTDVHAESGRNKLFKELQCYQKTLSYNIEDQIKLMSSARDEIGRVLKFEDKSAREILRKLSKSIRSFTDDSTREIHKNNILEQLEALKKSLSTDGYKAEARNIINSKIDDISKIIKNTDEKGIAEEMLMFLNKNLPKEEYLAIKNQTGQITRQVKKAFESEMKLYDKFAEYSVGSAPTDMLGLLLPLGLAGYAISKGENKDEKIAATLNAGIPIIGGVATTLYATAKMMTNIQGLLLGIGTGIVLNALGEKANESYKEAKDNKLFTEKAIAAYKKSQNLNIS